MLRSLRSALARFAVRRAAACQRDAPKRAALWLELGCALSPAFAEAYPALVRLRRSIEDRWGALTAAQEAAGRFPENPDAWMLLGEAFQMVFRQHDALIAFEQVLALEERPDAALAAGGLYRRAGRHAEAAARFAAADDAAGLLGGEGVQMVVRQHVALTASGQVLALEARPAAALAAGDLYRRAGRHAEAAARFARAYAAGGGAEALRYRSPAASAASG